jgi:hypothetical protein
MMASASWLTNRVISDSSPSTDHTQKNYHTGVPIFEVSGMMRYSPI